MMKYTIRSSRCVCTNKKALTKLLHEIETVSAHYGMRINKDKCELIRFHTMDIIHFRDGSRVLRKEEAEYLGCFLTQTNIS